MNTLDVGIAFLYVLGLFCWALWLGRRETPEDFLVFSRRAPLPLLTLSIVSTWVGVGTTVTTAASAYDTGISLGVTAALGGLVGVTVAALFAPRLKWYGDTFHAHTIGDFFRDRYSLSSSVAAGSLILLIYVLLAAAQFVGLAVLLQVWSGVDIRILVGLVCITTVIYTAYAGIKSDFYTDAIHCVIMFIVFVCVLLPITLFHVHIPANLHTLPKTYFDIFAYGGVLFFAAGLLLGGSTVFVTMEIWQRIYASRSPGVARGSLIASALVIIMFYLLSSYFGLAARIIRPGLANRSAALFVLMQDLLPRGLLGLGLAAVIAVFISTANSMLMVLSATAAKDFFKGLFSREASDIAVLRAARIAVGFFGIAALVVALVFPDIVTLSVNAFFLLLVLAPPIVGGLLWRRGTAYGATFSILAGSAVYAGALIVAPTKAFVPAFVASAVSYIVVSYRSRHNATEHIEIVGGHSESHLCKEEPRVTA